MLVGRGNSYMSMWGCTDRSKKIDEMLLVWTSTCFRKAFSLFGHPSWAVAFRVWGASMQYDFTVICSSLLGDFSRFRRWRANEDFSRFLGLGAKDGFLAYDFKVICRSLLGDFSCFGSAGQREASLHMTLK